MVPPEILYEGWPLLVLSSIFGLIIGSFLNVVIYRTPIMLARRWRAECYSYLKLEPPADAEATGGHYSIVWPLSACPKCSARIHAWQNIPVVSYLFLQGKCARCAAPIGIRYPLVEILTALLSALVMAQFGVTVEGFAALILTWILIVLAGIDIDTHLLPDSICLPLLWLGLVVNSCGLYTDLPASVWGAIIGYMSLWSVFWIFRLATGRDGMGFGDFKLLAALGAWMGWQALPMIILSASVSGLTIAIIRMVMFSHDRRAPIAFGPYLALGGWLSFMYSDQISGAIPILFPF